jgi:rhamnosyltransferase
LKNYPLRIIRIEPGEFNHGLTRNLGVREAGGKYIVMTVQDAKPKSNSWLQELLNGFTDDTVAGVCGQQVVPHDPDKNPAEWFRPLSKPSIRSYQFREKDVFLRLKPDEQLAICRWDDVNAMYRKDILTRIPFRNTDFAEDALWARDALLAGYTIVYNPLSQVEHYHHEDYEFAFNRNFIIQYHFYKYFGTIPEKSRNRFMKNLRLIKQLVAEKKIPFPAKWKWLKYNLRNQQAVIRSNQVFLESLQGGNPDSLDKLYLKLCQYIPQASISS